MRPRDRPNYAYIGAKKAPVSVSISTKVPVLLSGIPHIGGAGESPVSVSISTEWYLAPLSFLLTADGGGEDREARLGAQ